MVVVEVVAKRVAEQVDTLDIAWKEEPELELRMESCESQALDESQSAQSSSPLEPEQQSDVVKTDCVHEHWAHVLPVFLLQQEGP